MASKTCFVICAIGEDDSNTRRRADMIFTHVIEPVTRELEYEVTRADKEDKPGIITNDIIGHLLNDDVVIADMTDRNANVFYELGIRHTVRKPVIAMMQEGEEIPFDVAPVRAIKYDLLATDDPVQGAAKVLDSVVLCRDKLRRFLKAAEEKPDEVDSPVTMAVSLDELRASGDPATQTARLLMERFEQLAGEVRALGRRESTRSPSAPTRGVAPALGLSVSVADQLLQKTVFDGHDDLAAAVMLASPSLEPDHVADALMENPSARQLVADRGRLVPVFANAGVGPAVYQAVVARHAFLRDREEGDGPDGAADAQDAEAP